MNLDGGEHSFEPEELYALADLVHVACGGHAGDATSMARVVRACAKTKTRIGAHPSYLDREGFGRRPRVVTAEILAREVADQCASLRAVAEKEGAAVTSAKLHGALYHAAHLDDAIAHACVDGIRTALGDVAIVGPAGGELAHAAENAGLPYLREAFADRGVHADGTLIPRGEPGAMIEDPAEAARRAVAIASRGDVETLCVHADTAGSLAILRAVCVALEDVGAKK